jgi:hypothetical protein
MCFVPRNRFALHYDLQYFRPWDENRQKLCLSGRSRSELFHFESLAYAARPYHHPTPPHSSNGNYVTLLGHLTPRADTAFPARLETLAAPLVFSPLTGSPSFSTLANRQFLGSGVYRTHEPCPVVPMAVGPRDARPRLKTPSHAAAQRVWGPAIMVWKRAK